MTFFFFLSFLFILAGFITALFVLKRRLVWERANNQVIICVDFDDAWSASIRAGIRFEAMLEKLVHHGATHISLPELTLDRLLGQGLLRESAPRKVPALPPVTGYWNFLHGESRTVRLIASELKTRLPFSQAEVIDGDTLVFAGDLVTLGGIGLGFDDELAKNIISYGLKVVPQPVSYPWPEPILIHRTIEQASKYGHLIAFYSNIILGHELHLEATVDAMSQFGMTFVYFSVTRHQKGDWFLAKRQLPDVILGHRFTPQEMLQLDSHSAIHHWDYLIREHGIRFLYVDFFKELHALEPLECLHYLGHLVETIDPQKSIKKTSNAEPFPAFLVVQQGKLGLVAFVVAGTIALVINALFALELTTSVLTLLGLAAGVMMVPLIDKPRGFLEKKFPPLYAPKALALLVATVTPLAVISLLRMPWNGMILLGSGLFINLAAAAALAAFLTGMDFQRHIDVFRGFNLDWMLPLSAVAVIILDGNTRWVLLAIIFVAWLVSSYSRLDVLAFIDLPYPEIHVHHVSRINRIVGSFFRAIGLRPARKWAGIGPFGLVICYHLLRRNQPILSAGAAVLCVMGFAFWLAGFRRPERPLSVTAWGATISMLAGSVIALALLVWSGLE